MITTIGIDVGGTSLRAAVVDGAGHILDRARVPTPHTVPTLEDALTTVVKRLAQRHRVDAVGLAVAGFLDADCATVRFAPHLPWRAAAVRERMAERFGMPVVVEHDCNSAAWAEYVYGAAREGNCVVTLAIGTGIGGALIYRNELFRGAYGTAPEFGHLQVVRDGRPCSCGKRGCLERYCSGTALVDTVQELIAAHPDIPTVLGRDVAAEPDPTGRQVVAAARRHDRIAEMALADFSYWLGIGFATVADVFDPDLIVVGGGVGAAGDLFLHRAQDVYASHVTGAGYRPLATIKQAVFGDDAGQIGVADLARRFVHEHESK